MNAEFDQPLNAPPLPAWEANVDVPEAHDLSEIPSDTTKSDGQLTLFNRTTNVMVAAKEDYASSESKVRNISMGLGMLAMQGLDRMRASIVFVPTIAVDVLKDTHSPAEAAVAAGFAFGAWCTAVGGATTEALEQFPQAKQEVNNSFPGLVDFFQDALPGMEDPSTYKDLSHAKRLGRRILTGAKRGYTVAGIGSVAYVSTAAAKGRSRSDIHRLNLNASADGGAAIGAFVYGAAKVITEISHTHPELAQRIQNDASNIKLWYGVAGVMVASQYITNKFKRRRSSKQSDNLV